MNYNRIVRWMSSAEKRNLGASYYVVRFNETPNEAMQRAAEDEDLDTLARLALSELIENGPYRFQPLC